MKQYVPDEYIPVQIEIKANIAKTEYFEQIIFEQTIEKHSEAYLLYLVKLDFVLQETSLDYYDVGVIRILTGEKLRKGGIFENKKKAQKKFNDIKKEFEMLKN